MTKGRRRTISLWLGTLCLAATAAGQAPTRIATTPESLAANPLFFHGKQVVIHAEVTSTADTTRVDGVVKPIFVVWRESGTRGGGEIRGDFWDLGRLQPDDTRVSGIDFQPILDSANRGQWPGRDQIFVILRASRLDAELPSAPTVRAIALAPERFENKSVTLVGRFKGRNLYGDLPQAPGKSKWDFVLQSADAAVWITQLRPRGRGFDLDPQARVDTGRWLEITGTVRRDGPQVWIEGESVQQATAPEEAPVEVQVKLPPEPPPRVIFSAPVPEDIDVETTTSIRLQFSRPMDGTSFQARIRVSYAPPSQGQAPPPPAFTAAYDPGNRSVEIKFKEPLERFHTVKVELLEGIAAVDGQLLPPWTLTFLTGG
jgi:hypothetical protein